MRRGKTITMVMVLCMLVLAGCTTKPEADAGTAQLTERIAAYEGQVRDLEKENAAKEARMRILEEENTALSLELEVLKDAEQVIEPGRNAAVEYYPIYAMDVDSTQRVTVSFVGVERMRKLEGRLEEVAKALSSEVFEGLIISLKDVGSVDGKKIATFNLKDVPGREETWGNAYFQGSTGGSATVLALTHTLLQEDYQGDWIDGVRFLYEDQPIEYEHVEGMGSIFHRK